MGIMRRLREGMDFTFGATSHESIDTNSVTTTSLTFETFPRKALITAGTLASDAGWIYPVDTSGGAVTVTLASAMVAEGAHVIVNDEGGAAGTNAITIDTEGSETIDGATSQSVGSNYGTLTFYSDGANWFTKSSTGGGGTL